MKFVFMHDNAAYRKAKITCDFSEHKIFTSEKISEWSPSSLYLNSIEENGQLWRWNYMKMSNNVSYTSLSVIKINNLGNWTCWSKIKKQDRLLPFIEKNCHYIGLQMLQRLITYMFVNCSLIDYFIGLWLSLKYNFLVLHNIPRLFLFS